MEQKTEELKKQAVSKPVKAHVSDEKKAKVKELAEKMKQKTVMVISIKGLPSAQFQDIKKKLRSRADIMVVKKSLLNFALDHSGVKELHELVPFVDDSTAVLFSNDDAFEISGILSKEKSPSKAKAGQVAPHDIEVKAGPTELLPGRDISALSAVGLAPKVEDGKISIMQDKVLVKEGGVITDDQASIMAKLDIIPFEVGVEPVAAYMEGVVYKDIKIDTEAIVDAIMNAYGRALPFAVEVGIVNSTTLDFILAKAGAEEGTLTRVVTGEPEPEVVAPAAEEAPKEEKTEETKKEEPAGESAAGLASLF